MGIAASELSLAQGKLTVAAPFLIDQDWAAYTPEQHAVWSELVSRRMPQLREHACREYLDGFEQIGLQEDRLPDLKSVSARLGPRTGWQSTPVSGFLPADAFFEMLAARMFPTTTWLRSRDSMGYTPEPDIFHDVFGHVPMHAHPVFADFLQHYGKVCARPDARPGGARANGAPLLVHGGVRPDPAGWRSEGVWERADLVAWGVFAGAGGGCEVKDFDLEAVMTQEFQTSEMQPVLYAVESFDQIYEAAKLAESRLG